MDDSPLRADCSARQLLVAISSKWVTLVLLALSGTDLRHSELRRRIGASQKMLTATLRALERDGLVRRTVTPSVPPRSDYGLTERGASLLPIVEAMKAWADANMDDVAESRRLHEETSRRPQ
ncbi:winged helix-turn-helix transcriptional regulator [Leifsonia sp. NPDC056824]|uniref:winged helix-turn-helix transcriptional regulator n=1 Tax=Leifsonia sp. NPDC056824 TaxID=3345953 RepID=UPI0036B171FA